jgi:hypothetical protein
MKSKTTIEYEKLSKDEKDFNKTIEELQKHYRDNPTNKKTFKIINGYKNLLNDTIKRKKEIEEKNKTEGQKLFSYYYGKERK